MKSDLLQTPRPVGGYRCILADPPWRFVTYGPHSSKAPEQHYATSPVDQIRRLPVRQMAAANCWLLLWATWPCLLQAIDVMQAWGFEYKTGGAWAKQSSTGASWQFGTGYVFRSASEVLLVGSRGHPRWLSKSERNLWIAPVREHSRKPDEIHQMAERACPGPRLELFGRAQRPGWAVWGDQADKFQPG